MIRILRGLARIVFILVVIGVIGGGAFIGITLSYFGRDLPNSQQLASFVPASGTWAIAAASTAIEVCSAALISAG